jgi:hypothetical protein
MEVLRAAGVEVYEWNEDDLPSVAEARELFVPKSVTKEEQARIDAGGRRLLPVAEIQELLADGDSTDYGKLEPVPSGFYEDQDDMRGARRAA